MSRPGGTIPPRPPEPFPPQPPRFPRSPWQPESRPPGPGAVSSSAALVVGQDRLAERLLDQRVVTLAGELDADAVNRAVAELALLDATGDGPVRLQLSGVSAGLDAVLTLVDALDLMGVPVHATSLGRLTGPAVAVLAVADRRIAGPSATLYLCEPRAPHSGPGRDVGSWAAELARQLARLQERLAAACGRPAEQVAADMRTGRLFTANEAREYGLVDAPEPAGGPIR
ncbi:ClpP family protease [Geodermatophilus ruber]|uniref:ATP-dependent Clp protease proteolytic subunit n=1 Tax=Geodermatophilus ruber TaxID=504800 RepID=A0A1I3ZFZ6_9ACTN|nr:ATP-dependent Clp protease proteolytic subunit [Geodermatophilus ruber]SFK42830.1 ATP-dependent Clp protease, protease subunit [Geodermatophilus ruber]